MQRIPPLPVVIGLLVAVPGLLPAQGTPPDSMTVQSAAATLRSDLRNFVTAQEAHFADHGTYARSLRQMQHGYHTSSGVTLVLLTSSDSSHSRSRSTTRFPASSVRRLSATRRRRSARRKRVSRFVGAHSAAR